VTDLEFDPFIDEIARELKQPVRIDPRFDERVMAALEPAVVPISTRRPAVATRRTWSLGASLGGLAAAIGLMNSRDAVSATVAVTEGTQLVPVVNTVADPAAMLQETQFILVDNSAKSMSVVGQFNDWDQTATPMTFDSTHGAWSVTIPLLPGRHEFQYVIDGTRRVNDPTLPQVSSDFGSPNSVITVLPKP
jgi:hypothetical protein